MSTLEKNLYKNIKVDSAEAPKPQVKSRAYRGISTVNPSNTSYSLYDIALIKQDLINHFHIRKGEKLENPMFGTIIWDSIFEPLTPQLKDAIAKDVTEIINYDPRIRVESISVEAYESGIQISCDLTYIPYNISESMMMKFDENNGLIN
jgi:phage baseplate assembly protein W